MYAKSCEILQVLTIIKALHWNSTSIITIISVRRQNVSLGQSTSTCSIQMYLFRTGFIFEHLARNPRFGNVTRRLGNSRGPSGFLPVSTEGMSFFIGLFSKEKGTFGFLGALSPSKSPKSQKDLFSRKRTVKMTSPPTLEKSARSREYPGRLVTLSRRGAKS